MEAEFPFRDMERPLPVSEWSYSTMMSPGSTISPGDICRDGYGSIGIVTSIGKVPIPNVGRGKHGMRMAYSGIKILPTEKFGEMWSSTNPEIVSSDLRSVYAELVPES